MIHTCRQGAKWKKFVRSLRPHANNCAIDIEGVAVSLLERLWHATAISAKRGDIGRYDNDVIAEECGWLGEADLLIEILVDCGYLDECQEHRLLVHDWEQHAPNHVKGVVKRQNGFATLVADQGSEPKVTHPGSGPRSSTQGSQPPNLTKPNLTQPNQKTGASTSTYPEWFEEFWKAYPANSRGRKRGKRETLGVAKLVAKADRPLLVSAAENYGREETEFIRDPVRFVRNDWWRDWLSGPEKRKTESSYKEFGK